jgi:hypothetical protein
MKYYVYATNLDRGLFPILKIESFSQITKHSYCQKIIKLIDEMTNDSYVQYDDFMCVGSFDDSDEGKYIVIGLNHCALEQNIIFTNDPKKYIYDTLLKDKNDYDSEHEVEPNDSDNKIINMIDNKDDIIIDIEYRYHCLKTAGYDFDSCVRLINMNHKIKSNRIRDLKNSDGSEDYFTPIYVLDRSCEH